MRILTICEAHIWEYLLVLEKSRAVSTSMKIWILYSLVLRNDLCRGGQVHVKTVSHVCHKMAVFGKKIQARCVTKYWLFYLADLL